MLERMELKKKLIVRLKKQEEVFAVKTMHLLSYSLAAGTDLRIGPNMHRVHKEAYLVVIDEAPGAYWTHPVRYELYDVETGEVQVINEKYPLENQAINAQLEVLHSPGNLEI